jgi:hypothetical protein
LDFLISKIETFSSQIKQRMSIFSVGQLFVVDQKWNDFIIFVSWFALGTVKGVIQNVVVLLVLIVNGKWWGDHLSLSECGKHGGKEWVTELFVIKFGYLLHYGPCIFIVMTNWTFYKNILLVEFL